MFAARLIIHRFAFDFYLHWKSKLLFCQLNPNRKNPFPFVFNPFFAPRLDFVVFKDDELPLSNGVNIEVIGELFDAFLVIHFPVPTFEFDDVFVFVESGDDVQTLLF